MVRLAGLRSLSALNATVKQFDSPPPTVERWTLKDGHLDRIRQGPYLS